LRKRNQLGHPSSSCGAILYLFIAEIKKKHLEIRQSSDYVEVLNNSDLEIAFPRVFRRQTPGPLFVPWSTADGI